MIELVLNKRDNRGRVTNKQVSFRTADNGGQWLAGKLYKTVNQGRGNKPNQLSRVDPFFDVIAEETV